MNQKLTEIEDAWQLVEEHLGTNQTESVSLNETVGRSLAEPVVSDLNSPPFDKSLVDGFAIVNWNPDQHEYSIVETVTAGMVPSKKLVGCQATRIMTGCPIPDGATGVIMVEDTQALADDRVQLNIQSFRPGQNVLPEGEVIRCGQELIAAGTPIVPHQVGALAEFGYTNLKVYQKTRVAVLTTGDELVPPEQMPGPGQIRNSNASLLTELAKAAGADVVDLGIGRDNRESLNEKIKTGLERDVLVIAGGVSAGVLDLIPQCLADNGVKQVFHKINLKPGKPLWFGVSDNQCLVFGLPGNPVSSLVCFKLFAGQAIAKRANPSHQWLAKETGELAEDFSAKPGRRTFWPVRITRRDGKSLLFPLAWKGSADQVTFLNANGLMDLKGMEGKLEKGCPISFVEF